MDCFFSRLRNVMSPAGNRLLFCLQLFVTHIVSNQLLSQLLIGGVEKPTAMSGYIVYFCAVWWHDLHFAYLQLT